MEGIYLTWLISALAIGVLLMPLIRPPWSKITMDGFVDFLRRYWLHLVLVLLIYNAKDFLDEGIWFCGFKRPSNQIGLRP